MALTPHLTPVASAFSVDDAVDDDVDDAVDDDVVLWCCGAVVLWCCGAVVLWCCGVVMGCDVCLQGWCVLGRGGGHSGV
jgi:hypothetical protein